MYIYIYMIIYIYIHDIYSWVGHKIAGVFQQALLWIQLTFPSCGWPSNKDERIGGENDDLPRGPLLIGQLQQGHRCQLSQRHRFPKQIESWFHQSTMR